MGLTGPQVHVPLELATSVAVFLDVIARSTKSEEVQRVNSEFGRRVRRARERAVKQAETLRELEQKHEAERREGQACQSLMSALTALLGPAAGEATDSGGTPPDGHQVRWCRRCSPASRDECSCGAFS